MGVLQEDKGTKVDMAVKLWSIGVPFNQLTHSWGWYRPHRGAASFPNGTDPQ